MASSRGGEEGEECVPRRQQAELQHLHRMQYLK